MDEQVLLVEDDLAIREITGRGLTAAGFQVVEEPDGRQAVIASRRRRFDLVILDVMLPSMNGIEVCKEIRRLSPVPIIMLTAKAETPDVIAGLDSGADDYVTKPFEMSELIARIQALLRRASEEVDRKTIEIGDVLIDASAFKVTRRDEPIALSSTEFKLLLTLARHTGKALTREMLLEMVWGYDYLGDSRIVDMTIKRLRHKVEDDPVNPRMILTVRGVGYRLEPG